MNRITNNDHVGDYQVSIFASTRERARAVCSFQTATFRDAVHEANRIRVERAEKNLPTYACAQLITGRTRWAHRKPSKLTLGPVQPIEF